MSQKLPTVNLVPFSVFNVIFKLLYAGFRFTHLTYKSVPVPRFIRCTAANVYLLFMAFEVSTLFRTVVKFDRRSRKNTFHPAKRMIRIIFEEHIEKAGLDIHEFSGKRCDFIVKSVLKKLAL